MDQYKDLKAYSLDIVSNLIHAGFTDDQIEYATKKILNDETSIHPDPMYEGAFRLLETEIKLQSLEHLGRQKTGPND